MPKLVNGESFVLDEFAGQTMHIMGASGKLGQDLGKVSMACGLQLVPQPQDANFIALCTPSYVAETVLSSGVHNDKTIIDLSGAAKRSGRGQYGLMRTESRPWDADIDVNANVYGNPGCIASAVILGLGAAGLTDALLPHDISVFSVGGRSHAPSVQNGDIKLARRLLDHPHVAEIQKAYGDQVTVSSFMPTICDVPRGLLVGVHGKTLPHPQLRSGIQELSVQNVVGTHLLQHKLVYDTHQQTSDGLVDFSLAVVIDNIRFVTTNVMHLLRFIKNERK